MRILRIDSLGSFYRLNDGVLECQAQLADPKLNIPSEEEWCEVDWERGVEPEDLGYMKEIMESLQFAEAN